MHEFHGDLLIGGLRLKHVRCELEEETPQDGSLDWRFAGHLHLPAAQRPLLETERPYRLELEDGRSGQVVLSRIVPENDQEQLADFQAKTRP